MNLLEENKENGIIERIEKYIESDEAKIRKFDFCYKFVENIITNFNIDNYFKEKYQRINLFNPDFVYAGFSCDNNKIFKVWIILYYAKILHEIGEKFPDIKKNIQDIIKKLMDKKIN